MHRMYPRYHLACVLLLDKSGSMSGKPMDTLNQALFEFKKMCNAKCIDRYELMIDLCIISFGGRGSIGGEPDIEILQSFAPTNEVFYDKPLIANETTPLAEAVERGLKEIAGIKEIYKHNDIEYLRPWLICLTDGESTEDEAYYNSVKESLKKAVNDKHVFADGIAIGDAGNYKKLTDFFGEKNTYRFEDHMNAGGFERILESHYRQWCYENDMPR